MADLGPDLIWGCCCAWDAYDMQFGSDEQTYEHQDSCGTKPANTLLQVTNT